MSYYLCPLSAILQYFNNTGVVLSGGKIYTYTAGTSSPQTTYTDSTGITANANPIILDSAGRLPNVTIWQPAGVALKLIFTDASDNPIGPTFDQVSGINDPTAFGAELADAASGFGVDLVANAMRSYDVIASLRAANVPVLGGGQTLVVCVQGSSVAGDAGGGLFFWNATSSAADDGVTVIKPTGESGSGRYVRLVQIGVISFVANLTGMTATITGNISQEINGNIVTLTLTGGNAITGTSNSTSFTINNLPTYSQPVYKTIVPCILEDNSQLVSGWATISGGTITFGSGANYSSGGFTASGFKGLPQGWTISYVKS